MIASLLLALAAAAPPADADRALAELASFGPVSPCVPQEMIVEPQDVPEGMTAMHGHVLVAVQPLPSLKGKSAPLVPYLDHPSRRVVRRAVDLLCRVQDDAAKAALLATARKHPCFDFAREALLGGGIDAQPTPAKDCQGYDREGLVPGSAPDWARWATPAARTVAGELSRGGEAAFRRARAELDSIDLARVREATAALSLVRTRVGWTSLARTFASDRGITYLNFVQGLGPATLRAVAEANQTTLGRELLEQVRAAPDLAEPAWYIARVDSAAFQELSATAAAERRKSGTPAHLAAWLERFEEEQGLTNPGEYSKVSKRLDQMHSAGDEAGLRAYMKDAGNDRLHRLYAGSLLAQLGRVDGLDLFEDPQSVKSGQAFVIKSELEGLRQKTSGAIRARVEKLLKLYAPARHPFEDARESLEVR